MSKIFGIGLPRTGTASLSEALVILGYKTRHYPKFISKADKFDALVDTPICNCFEELDKRYPGSRFILTVRSPTKWLKSCEKASKRFRWHSLAPDARCGPEVYKSHIDLFGTTSYDKTKFIRGFLRHFNRVLDYFADRPSSLLVYDVNEGWNPLCEFLDKQVPSELFPHRNKSR